MTVEVIFIPERAYSSLEVNWEQNTNTREGKGVEPFAENEVQNTLLSNYQSFGVVWYSEQLLLIFLVPPL